MSTQKLCNGKMLQMNDAILKFRRYEDASLEYTGVNRHASDTRIGLMDSTVPIEAMLEH